MTRSVWRRFWRELRDSMYQNFGRPGGPLGPVWHAAAAWTPEYVADVAEATRHFRAMARAKTRRDRQRSLGRNRAYWARRQ